MSFKPPFLCYPVEESEGYVIRIKPEEEGEECFDFLLTPENSPTFYQAAVKAAGIVNSDGDEDVEDVNSEDDKSDLIDLKDPYERRMAVIEQVNSYAESHGVPVPEFFNMCTALTEFVETGKFPKSTKLTRVK